MRMKDIDLSVVKDVVKSLDDTFHTRDVSDDSRMMEAHGVRKDDHLFDNYHSMVGRVLGKYYRDASRARLDEIKKATPRGSLWRKR